MEICKFSAEKLELEKEHQIQILELKKKVKISEIKTTPR